MLAACIFGGVDSSIPKVLDAYRCSTWASLASISASQTHMQKWRCYMFECTASLFTEEIDQPGRYYSLICVIQSLREKKVPRRTSRERSTKLEKSPRRTAKASIGLYHKTTDKLPNLLCQLPTSAELDGPSHVHVFSHQLTKR